jgi:lysozyme
MGFLPGITSIINPVTQIFIKTPTITTQENPMIRPTPLQAIVIIKKFEGLRLRAYPDSDGIWTIGFGEIAGVKEGDVITEEQADDYLREYLQGIGTKILKIVRCPLNNNQYSALLSFVYNCGLGAFESSTLLKLINTKETAQLTQEFVKWDKDEKGTVLPGLYARRMAEASLYFTPISEIN